MKSTFMILIILLSIIALVSGSEITEVSVTKDYYYLYDYKPVYEPVLYYDNITIKESETLKNGTLIPPVIDTKIIKLEPKITSYDKSDVKGVVIDGKTIIGVVNYDSQKDVVYKWKYPQADRNMEDPEFNKCRGYELRKGVCEVVKP